MKDAIKDVVNACFLAATKNKLASAIVVLCMMTLLGGIASVSGWIFLTVRDLPASYASIDEVHRLESCIEQFKKEQKEDFSSFRTRYREDFFEQRRIFREDLKSLKEDIQQMLDELKKELKEHERGDVSKRDPDTN